MSKRIQQMLHVKPEDLRLYNLSNEDNPVLLEDETQTIEELEFKDGQKILVEGNVSCYNYDSRMCNLSCLVIVCSSKQGQLLARGTHCYHE